MKTSFKPTVMLIAGRALSFVVTFFIPVILVRIFSQQTFGAYKQVFLIYVILYGIGQLGMAESLYYFLPSRATDGGKIVLNSVVTLALAGITCLCALAGFAPTVAQWLGNPQVAEYMVPLGVFVLLMLVTAVLEISMISRKRYGLASYTYAISDVLRSVFLIVPVVLWKSLHALMIGAMTFAALRLLYTAGYLLWEFGASELRLDWPNLRNQFAYTLPFELAIIVETMQTNYHQYAVSHYFGAAAFAIYAVGCLQLPFVDLVAGPACNVMMVRMAEEVAAGSKTRSFRIWTDTTRKLALLFFPLFALLLVSSREIILLLFTDRYASAIPIFVLWSSVVPLAVFQTDGLLRVYGQTRFILICNLLRLAMIAGMIGGFLQFFGLRGAVLITLLATCVSKLLALVKATDFMEVRFYRVLPWSSLASASAASIAAALPAWVVKTQLHLPFVPLLALMGITFAVSYASLVLGFDLLTKGERIAVMNWLRGFIPWKAKGDATQRSFAATVTGSVPREVHASEGQGD